MAIWELRCGSANDHAMLAPLDQGDIAANIFVADGAPKDWKDRPPVAYETGSRKKKPAPRADVSLFVSGALALNQRARDALGGFLSGFGQLLELDHGGELLYFFNATNLVDCVDEARSERFEDGVVMMKAFDESKAPKEAAVFKDPRTARVRLYVNDAGKRTIEELVAGAGIIGIECGPPLPL